MDNKNAEVFKAITAFVDDLWDVYQSGKPTPLALYHRMIKHINKEHSESGIKDSIDGFIKFFAKYEKNILENNLDSIPRGVVINYGQSEKVFLEIQKYIHMSSKDQDTRDAIRKHLVTISTILEPDVRKFEVLNAKNNLGIDETTSEGKFISNIMKEAQNSMGDVDTDNPAAAMSVLFSSVVPQLVTGLQEGVNSGNMDMYKLMGTMQAALGAIMPKPPPEESVSSNLETLSIEEVKQE